MQILACILAEQNCLTRVAIHQILNQTVWCNAQQHNLGNYLHRQTVSTKYQHIIILLYNCALLRQNIKGHIYYGLSVRGLSSVSLLLHDGFILYTQQNINDLLYTTKYKRFFVPNLVRFYQIYSQIMQHTIWKVNVR